MVKLMIMMVMMLISAQANLGQKGPISDQDQAKNLLEMFSKVLEVSSKDNKYCPPPYSHIFGECFYVHKFVPLLSWNEANNFCKQAGGILAEPRYFGAVIANLYNQGMASEIYDGRFRTAWLGGRRVTNSSSNFKWLSGRPITENVGVQEYSYHPNSEPADCLMMELGHEMAHRLAFTYCDSRFHYVCQLPEA